MEKAKWVFSLSQFHSATSHQDAYWKWACLFFLIFFHRLLSCLPPASGNDNIIYLMPPYETFTALWMLSTFSLNWMFANKSHGAGGWHDSPSAPLGVILPHNAQGKQICIHSMTNLAVCFHWAGVHIIYVSPPSFSFRLSLPVSFSFRLPPSHYASLLRACQCVILQSSVKARNTCRKYIFYWIYFSRWCEGNWWGVGAVDWDQVLNITEREFTKGQPRASSMQI